MIIFAGTETNDDYDRNIDHGSNVSDEATNSKIENLLLAYNDIQDRLYEIDKSWKNNLIFYGIPLESSSIEDEDPYVTEEKVRELIKRKLRITREIPFNRVSRVFHGPEFRGQKPVQVRKYFSRNNFQIIYEFFLNKFFKFLDPAFNGKFH